MFKKLDLVSGSPDGEDLVDSAVAGHCDHRVDGHDHALRHQVARAARRLRSPGTGPQSTAPYAPHPSHGSRCVTATASPSSKGHRSCLAEPRTSPNTAPWIPSLSPATRERKTHALRPPTRPPADLLSNRPPGLGPAGPPPVLRDHHRLGDPPADAA